MNSLDDISQSVDYSAIAGITEEELVATFSDLVAKIAEKKGREPLAIWQEMRAWYNGYRFSPQQDAQSVYNPWSILNYFKSGGWRDNYWFESGTPTFAIKMIQKFEFPIEEFERGIPLLKSGLSNHTHESLDLVSLLLQTGYLTIDRFDESLSSYVLKLPNEEVRQSLLQHLFSEYTQQEVWKTQRVFQELGDQLRRRDLNGFFVGFNRLLAEVPHHLHIPKEGYYHSLLYLFVRMLGFASDAEVTTSLGRIDLVVRTGDTAFIFEFKFDRSASEALEQIKSRSYAEQFKLDQRKVLLVGANFSSASRSIDDWTVEELIF